MNWIFKTWASNTNLEQLSIKKKWYFCVAVSLINFFYIWVWLCQEEVRLKSKISQWYIHGYYNIYDKINHLNWSWFDYQTVNNFCNWTVLNSTTQKTNHMTGPWWHFLKIVISFFWENYVHIRKYYHHKWNVECVNRYKMQPLESSRTLFCEIQ